MRDNPRTNSTRVKAKAAAMDDLSVIVGISNHKGESKPKTTSPKDIEGKSCLLPTWVFMTWHGACLSITVITAKAQSQWKMLDEAQLLPHMIDMVQWVYHFFGYSNSFR